MTFLVKTSFLSQTVAAVTLLLFGSSFLVYPSAAETPKEAEIPATSALKLPEALTTAGFKVFGELVAKSPLAEKLREDRQFTCFAPTDEAFAAMPADQLAALKSETNKAEQLLWLESHFVPDLTLKKADLLKLRILNTMATRKILYVWVRIEEIFINKTSPLVSPDIPAQNGVIHGVSKLFVAEEDAPNQPLIRSWD